MSSPLKSTQPGRCGPTGRQCASARRGSCPKINSLVAEIRDASATTIEDFLALLDVALEHELDLAPEIAFYGPADYPIITRVLRAPASTAPGFEFNAIDPRTVEPIGLDDPKTLAADCSPQRERKGAGTSA